MKRIIRNFTFIGFVMMVITITSGCKDDNSYTTNPPGGGGGGTPGANEVWMQGNAFTPAAKTVTSGTTLTWTNKSGTVHTVTSGVPNAPDGIFNSGNMVNGTTFTHTFNTTGTFRYYCVIHGSMMTGTITVE